MTKRKFLLGGIAAILSAQKMPAIQIRSIVGGHGIGRSANYHYTSQDYIQNGLVAMWDGIENEGVVIHNDATTIWKDLVDGRDIALKGAVVGEDSISWNSNVRSSSPYGPPEFVQMEVVFKSMSGYNWKLWFGDYGHSIISYFGAVIESKTAAQDNSSYRFWARAVSIPLHQPEVYGQRWATSIYQYGTKKNIVKGNFNHTMTDWESDTIQIGGRAGLSLHSIRLYSRYLTNEEVAYNYMIDKKRFGV